MTANPQELVEAINMEMKDGKLKTWERKFNAVNETIYNHNTEAWSDKVMIKPFVGKDRVSFRTTYWTGKEAPTDAQRGYVIGRFVELLMVHFNKRFSRLEITS